MTEDQVKLVQSSWAQVAPTSDDAARLFYGRLFEIEPDTRPLFPADLDEQGRKLMAMLGMVVNGLDRLADLVPAVEALGRRHATYGVVPMHYDAVGAALLWTLDQGLGPDAFTVDVRDAWARAYALLAETMQAAAATATAA